MESSSGLLQESTRTAASTAQRSEVNRGTVSEEQFDVLTSILSYVYVILVVPAFVTSIVNAAILSRSRHGGAFACCYTGLSVADAAVALCAIVYLTTVCFCPASSIARLVVQYYFSTFLSTAAQRAGVWFNALACLERFVAIVFPLRTASSSMPSSRKTLVSLAVAVFVTSFLAHAYIGLQFNVQLVANGTYGLVPTQLMRSSANLLQVASFASRVIMLYAPLVIIFLLNIVMAMALRVHAAQFNLRATRGRREVKDRDRRQEQKPELQVTRMVLGLSFAVVCLQSPAAINASVGAVHSEYGAVKKESNLYFILNYALFQLTVLNQPVIFLISFLHSRRFADAFWRLWCKCLRRPSAIHDRKSTEGELTRSFRAVSS